MIFLVGCIWVFLRPLANMELQTRERAFLAREEVQVSEPWLWRRLCKSQLGESDGTSAVKSIQEVGSRQVKEHAVWTMPRE